MVYKKSMDTNGLCPLSSDGLEVVCCEDCVFHMGADDKGRPICSNPYISRTQV